jgi:hypothetical protein
MNFWSVCPAAACLYKKTKDNGLKRAADVRCLLISDHIGIIPAIITVCSAMPTQPKGKTELTGVQKPMDSIKVICFKKESFSFEPGNRPEKKVSYGEIPAE